MRIRPILTAAALATASLGIYAAVATSANAAVSPTTIYTAAGANGTAGEYVFPTQTGQRFNGVTEQSYVRQSQTYGSGIPGSAPNADIGAKLCQFNASGDEADIYGVYNQAAGGMEYFAAAGVASGTGKTCLNGLTALTTLNSGNPIGGGTAGDPAAVVPIGHYVKETITESRNGTLSFSVLDETLQIGSISVQAHPFGFVWFDRAGVGTDTDTATLTSPASNVLARFTSVQARVGDNHSFGWVNFNNSSAVEGVRVNATPSGTSTTSALLSATKTTAAGFTLNMGQQSG